MKSIKQTKSRWQKMKEAYTQSGSNSFLSVDFVGCLARWVGACLPNLGRYAKPSFVVVQKTYIRVCC